MNDRHVEAGTPSAALNGQQQTNTSLTNSPVYVVSLGALCSLRSPSKQALNDGFRSVSIGIVEFAVLSNGSRITIRSDRGVGIGWTGEVASASEKEIRNAVYGALLPDEGDVQDSGEILPWHELASLLSETGVMVTPETLKHLPYELEFSPELHKYFYN